MSPARLHFIFALIFITLCCTSTNGYSATRIDDITIAPGINPSGNSNHGYAEYKISVTNHSPETMHVVTLILPHDHYTNASDRIREITRSVVVGPDTTAQVSILQPPVALHGDDLAIAIDGRRQGEGISLPVGSHAHGTSHLRASRMMPGAMGFSTLPLALQVLVSRNVDTLELYTNAGPLVGTIPDRSGFRFSSSAGGSSFTRTTTSSSSGPTSYDLIDLGFPVSAWSASWLGFSRFDGVVVTDEDIQKMPSDVRSALWEYVECGGALLLLGGDNLPDDWAARIEIPDESAGIAHNHIGFGECIVSARKDASGLNKDQWLRIVYSWVKTTTPWQTLYAVAEANTRFPVVSDFGVPVRGLFLLMLVFAIVIGPVNLIVLSRKKRRIWMLWTIPMISLITCLTVFLYATFAEGWNRYIRTDGLTILDQRSNRATSIGLTAFYSALTPGDGLHFGYETEVTPQVVAATSIPRSVDWTHDQHLARGWVTARVPAHFKVRKSEVRRERIAVRRGEGARLSIVNGLGADIDQFWLADTDGAIYFGRGISAGAEAKLDLQEDMQLPSRGEAGEMFNLQLWDPTVNAELDKEIFPEILRDEMKMHGAPLTDDIIVSVEESGRVWKLTDQAWERNNTNKADGPKSKLKINYGIIGLGG
ncbi:MAG: hypothetical protein OXI86_01230, partial [Candidatus Poribacteria bacterium]|nr:hypothetical protein [Candidatus Poribacteria bacterium]